MTQPRVVQVWWADLRSAEMSAAQRLPAAERARLDELDDQAARGRRLVGELLLQSAVRHARGLADDALVEIDRTCAQCRRQHGRPTVADGAGPHLSVAHAGVLVAVATCAGAPVGIDVERARAEVDIAGWVLAEARLKVGVELAGGSAGAGDSGGSHSVVLDAPLDGYRAALVVAGAGPVEVVEHHVDSDVDHI